MGERGRNCFLRFLRFPAVPCGFLQFSVAMQIKDQICKICENPRQAAGSPFSSLPFSAAQCPNSRKEKININKFAGIVPGLGGCRNFVYVFSFGSFLMGEKNT